MYHLGIFNAVSVSNSQQSQALFIMSYLIQFGLYKGMISIIQRVSSAKVTISGEDVGIIERGIMALVAVEPLDTEKDAKRLLERILNYRIFPDASDKMNLSLRDINGGLLIVPQFTLAADTQKGNRPSFTSAASPEYGLKLFHYFAEQAQATYSSVAFGQFGADMQVSLVNDGPVTFTLRSITQSSSS